MEINFGIRVVLDNLPTSIKGFVFIDSTYSPVIVLNARLPYEVQQMTFYHEWLHIKDGDLDNTDYREYSA